MNNNIKEILIYGIVVVLITGVITGGFWGAARFISDRSSSYETIKPNDNIECVVVSRMFNTSVDCWRVEE